MDVIIPATNYLKEGLEGDIVTTEIACSCDTKCVDELVLILGH